MLSVAAAPYVSAAVIVVEAPLTGSVIVMFCAPSAVRRRGKNHLACIDGKLRHRSSSYCRIESRSEAGALHGDRTALYADSCRRNGVRVEDVSVIAVIGASIAAQIGDADQVAAGGENLRIQPRHAEGRLVKRDGVNVGGAVPCGSDAAHIPMTGCIFTSLALPDSSNAVTATDKRAIGLRRKNEIWDVAVVVQRRDPITAERQGGGHSP